MKFLNFFKCCITKKKQNGTIKKNENVIKSNSRMIFKKQLCTICFENINFFDKNFRCPNSHMFHKVCISRWMQEKATCPVCRVIIYFNNKKFHDNLPPLTLRRSNVMHDF